MKNTLKFKAESNSKVLEAVSFLTEKIDAIVEAKKLIKEAGEYEKSLKSLFNKRIQTGTDIVVTLNDNESIKVSSRAASGAGLWQTNDRLILALLDSDEAKSSVSTFFTMGFNSSKGFSVKIRETVEEIVSSLQKNGLAGIKFQKEPESVFTINPDRNAFSASVKLL